MNIPELWKVKSICAECCNVIDTLYHFRKKCFRNKKVLTDYLTQLQKYSNISGQLNVFLIDIRSHLYEERAEVKTEVDDNEDTDNFISEACDDSSDMLIVKTEDSIIENGNDSPFKIAHSQNDIKSIIEKEEADLKMENTVLDSRNTLEDFTTIDCRQDINLVTEEEEGYEIEEVFNHSSSDQDESDLQQTREQEKRIGEDNIHGLTLPQGNNTETPAKREILKENETPEEKLYQCKMCDVKIMYPNNYPHQLLIQNEKKTLESKVNNTLLGFMSEKYNLLNLKCDKATLEKLKRMYLLKKGVCDVCHKTFPDYKSAKNHMRTHTRERKFECVTCAKKFFSNSHLKEHVKTHTGEKPFQCSKCNKKCGKLYNLMEHMRTHTGEKPFQCDKCGLQLSSRTNLSKHLLIHSNQRPYACNVCDKKFTTKSYLTEHMKIHSDTKPYKCNVCPARFSKKCYLAIHERGHNEKKPFQCEICYKRFTVKGHLTVHMCLHTGEILYKCELCPKKFFQAGNLTLHMRTHTGQRPFQCKICDRKFTQICNLKTHIRRIHEKDKHNKTI